MTEPQKQLYFREWGKARKVLIQAGFTAKEAAAKRLEIHEEYGLPASSKNFNKTSHLDDFICACRTICGTSNIDVQDQARKRLIHLIKQTGLEDAYLNHLARAKKEGFDWQTLDNEKLRHLLITAKKRAESREEKLKQKQS